MNDNFELVYYSDDSGMSVYHNNYMQVAILMIYRKVVLTIDYNDYMVDDFKDDLFKLCNYGCNRQHIIDLYKHFEKQFLYDEDDKQDLLNTMKRIGIEL